MTLQCGLAVGLRLCPEISGLSSKSQETCPSKICNQNVGASRSGPGEIVHSQTVSHRNSCTADFVA